MTAANVRCFAQRVRVRIGMLQVTRTNGAPCSIAHTAQAVRRVATAAAAAQTQTQTQSHGPLASGTEHVRGARPISPSRFSIDDDIEVPRPPGSGAEPRPQQPVPQQSPSRRERLKDARPLADFLTDTFGRQHDYLRISVTERCNLRCLYCMPEEGVPLSPQKELLTTPEILLLSSVFVSQGVTKIRLTGGEPTVRRDIVPLMQQIGSLRSHGLRELCLTTNGLSLHRKLDAMAEAGLTGVNLSLDTLDPWQFQLMTRRAGFAAVQKSIDRIFELNRLGAGIKFKINCVVMRGLNDREILPFVELTRDKDVEVRFIEYMPFDGNKWSKGKMFSYQEMLHVIRARYPDVHRSRDQHKNDTSKTYQVPGFVGRIGFITSMTHNFCGTCNRLRITSDGNLKVCLFGNAEVSLRDIVRQVNKGEPIDAEVFESMKQVAMDERRHLSPSDRGPPLLAPNSQELLDVIGMAVKRKKEKHAGIGELEHMKNRPMILIDPISRATPPPPPRHVHVPPRMPRWSSIGITTSSLVSSSSTATKQPAATSIPCHLLGTVPQSLRLFSTTPSRRSDSNEDDGTENSKQQQTPQTQKLTHVSDTGSAHMVSISDKTPTKRVATAKCTVYFSNPTALGLVRENQMKKGDVLGVARIAGIMAAKRTPDLIPLCHPIAISHVSVDLDPVSASSSSSPEAEQPSKPETEPLQEREDTPGASVNDTDRIEITATVACEGKTGVEMEALMAASTAALTVYDMCKAVDNGMIIDGLRVVLKEGGKSGRWVAK
ncbi:putative molybdenum cofactor biosynthesis protein 1 B [Diplogelasinospora grovesii]|uniref:Molybdenum cofactor biosynthesis protein 1 B n=1 Tax=Diplogelasinospora grovesii TaxID=303347 RepID=A0AAN6S4V2_9PEZI|nr:putative molybdenum cofactor biosynthesis protein 1 B [Diplogelasinospora grovesii]